MSKSECGSDIITGHDLFRAIGHKDFLYSNLAIKQDSQVVILGGYEGSSCLEILTRYNPRIIVFEPIEVWAQKIIELTAASKDKVQVVSKAVTSNGRDMHLFLLGDATSEKQGSVPSEVLKVTSLSVREVCRLVSYKIDVLEVNIEGGEYEVLNELLDEDIQVGTLLVQFHKIDEESEAKREEIRLKLRKRYEPIFNIPFIWERWDSKISIESLVAKRQFEDVSKFIIELQNTHQRQLSQKTYESETILKRLKIVSDELRIVRSSRSWRITAPFRQIVYLCRRVLSQDEP
jgi:FkbM family methyltransferase